MNAQPVPDIDASMVIGMASTAIPFARSREDQAERWLRILRMHGEAGIALHELGVSEGPADGGAGTSRGRLSPAAGAGERRRPRRSGSGQGGRGAWLACRPDTGRSGGRDGASTARTSIAC